MNISNNFSVKNFGAFSRYSAKNSVNNTPTSQSTFSTNALSFGKENDRTKSSIHYDPYLKCMVEIPFEDKDNNETETDDCYAVEDYNYDDYNDCFYGARKDDNDSSDSSKNKTYSVDSNYDDIIGESYGVPNIKGIDFSIVSNDKKPTKDEDDIEYNEGNFYIS